MINYRVFPICILSPAMLFLMISGCAHHKDVRPGVDGTHKVILQVEDQSQGGRRALKQARHFCEKRNKSAAIISEKTKYVGSMDEETYRAGKTASKVATGLGGAAAVFGGEKERNAGGAVGIGGAVADSVLGEGYQFTMKFKCM